MVLESRFSLATKRRPDRFCRRAVDGYKRGAGFHGGRVVARLSVHNSRGGGAFEARDTNVGRHRHVSA
jgi:hypothetical protein